jgi:signal transduction histidine kinase
VYVLETQELAGDDKLQLYWNILLCYWNTDLDKNIRYANEAICFAEKEHNNLWASKFNRAITMSYYRKGEFDSSLRSGENAVQYAIKAGDKREENAARLEIGNMYLIAGNREMALKCYTDMLPALEEAKQIEQCANTLINIAIIHNQFHDKERALHYLRQADVIAEKYNLIRPKMGIYSVMVNVYNENRQLDSAALYAEKSYEIAKKENDIPHMIICTQMLSGVYGDLNDLGKAKQYADECLAMATRFGDKRKLSVAWITVAKANFNMKQYDECDTYAYKAWEADSTDLQQAENATSYLCKANINLGNQERAYYFFDKYQSIRDQMGEKSLHDSLSDMEVKYETEKKEMRIAALEKEKEFHLWLSIAGVVVFLLIIGLLIFAYRFNAQKRKLAEQQILHLEQEKRLITTQAALDGETAERSRLARDLHDGLGGTLSVIKLNLKGIKTYSVMDASDIDRFNHALTTLEQSIGEVRRVAHNLMPEALFREGLKTALECFCVDIPNAHFRFFGEDKRLEGNLEILFYRCAYELINNAMKYAEAQNIHVQLIIDKELVSLTVQDDGCGFIPENVTRGTGLNNIRARVSSCNGRMNLYSTPGNGTEACIEIELPDEKNTNKEIEPEIK